MRQLAFVTAVFALVGLSSFNCGGASAFAAQANSNFALAGDDVVGDPGDSSSEPAAGSDEPASDDKGDQPDDTTSSQQ
jgi:hypothetical protein